jgi:hypothetical protein
VPKTNRPAAPDAKAGLLLNRLLFERKGDEFIDALAEMVRNEKLVIGDEPLLHLLEVARSVRSSVGIQHRDERPSGCVSDDR